MSRNVNIMCHLVLTICPQQNLDCLSLLLISRSGMPYYTRHAGKLNLSHRSKIMPSHIARLRLSASDCHRRSISPSYKFV